MSDKDVRDRRAAEELERQGDEAARSGGEAVNLYRAAQKTLLPVGILWSDAAEHELRRTAFDRIQQKIWALSSSPPGPRPPAGPSEPYDRFMASTNVGYEQWHDGIGYDLDALARIGGDERRTVSDLLVRRVRSGEADWRDVEALDALQLPEARDVLLAALETSRPETALHIARLLTARGIATRLDRIIAEILKGGSYGDGLSLALDLAATHATPYLRDVLLDCARDGHPNVRVHAAALCLYLAGKAEAPFDWSQRPFLLRFGDEDRETRRRAFDELCARIGAEGGRWPKTPT